MPPAEANVTPPHRRLPDANEDEYCSDILRPAAMVAHKPMP